MPREYISTVLLPNDETTYYIKDSEAQTALAGKIDNPATKVNGNFLKYNGTAWVAADVPESGVLSVTSGDSVIDVTGTSAVTVSSNIASSQGNVTLSKATDGLKANIADAALTIAKTDGLQTALDGKQATLVSGTNLKTVNNNSLLGSGNLSVGTITGITMNGSSKGTSGVVNLGTVITAHQDISGKENTSNKVTALSASSTDAQYPSAKAVYTVTEDIRGIAQGKVKGYVINAKSDITGTETAAGDFTNVTAITGVTIANLQLGDNIYVKALETPDYWVSQTTPSVSLNRLETSKVDLSAYAKTADLGALAFKDTASGSVTPAGTVSTPTITVTPTTTTVNSITAVGTLPTHGADSFTQGSFTQGTFTQGSLPSWSASVTGEVLSFSFSAGTLPTHGNDSFTKPTFTQGTFTQGTLPTKGNNTTVATGIQSATSTQPTFTGTAGTVTVA